MVTLFENKFSGLSCVRDGGIIIVLRNSIPIYRVKISSVITIYPLYKSKFGEHAEVLNFVSPRYWYLWQIIVKPKLLSRTNKRCDRNNKKEAIDYFICKYGLKIRSSSNRSMSLYGTLITNGFFCDFRISDHWDSGNFNKIEPHETFGVYMLQLKPIETQK